MKFNTQSADHQPAIITITLKTQLLVGDPEKL